MAENPPSEESESDTSVEVKHLEVKAVSPTGFQKKDIKTTIQIKRASSVPVIERRNWLIHTHYVRKEFTTCKISSAWLEIQAHINFSIIKEQLKETKGQCEYAIYIQAMILRSEGEIQSSMELFQACHLIDPTNPENLKQVARNLVLLGKHKSAIECYNKAADLSSKDWNICHCLGVCYHFLKDKQQAVECFTEALSLRKHVETFQALSQLYIDYDEKDSAMEVLKGGVEFAPENIDLLTTLGLLHLQKEDFHRAFELLGQVLTYDPENYKAILAVSSLMQRHEDFDVALNKYRITAHTVPESSSVWNNVGMCYFGKKKTIPAISCLKRAHYHAPFDWKILYNLSLVHLTTQQYVSAFHFASAGIALNSKDAQLFGLLAIALSHLDQKENASRAYEQAVTLSTNDIYILLNYCIFLHNIAKNSKAAKLMSKINSKFDMNEWRKTDKEVFDMHGKLSAALQVGDKAVSESVRPKKPAAAALPTDATASSSLPPESQAEDQLNNETSDHSSIPFASSGSALQAPRKKLSPLLPPISHSVDTNSSLLNPLSPRKLF